MVLVVFMSFGISFDEFTQVSADYAGVYCLYLKDNANLDIFIPTIREQLAKKQNNIIYIGSSKTIMRRIYANHLQGVGASTLRNTLLVFLAKNDFIIKNVSINKSAIISNWLKENTYFKIYQTSNFCQCEKDLIQKYQPILNNGRRKFKDELEKYSEN